MGLSTRIYTTKVKDSAENSLAECNPAGERPSVYNDGGFDEPRWIEAEHEPWSMELGGEARLLDTQQVPSLSPMRES